MFYTTFQLLQDFSTRFCLQLLQHNYLPLNVTRNMHNVLTLTHTWGRSISFRLFHDKGIFRKPFLCAGRIVLIGLWPQAQGDELTVRFFYDRHQNSSQDKSLRNSSLNSSARLGFCPHFLICKLKSRDSCEGFQFTQECLPPKASVCALGPSGPLL